MSVRLASPDALNRQAVWDLVTAFAVAVLLFLLVLVYNLDVLFGSYLDPTLLSSARLLVNSLIVWLAALLVVAFLRWRDAAGLSRDLHAVVSSISPDAIVVITPDRTITACNRSVDRIFGYSPDEVVGNKTDMLYYDRRMTCAFADEIYAALERDGFHVGNGRGRRKNGTEIDLEIVSAVLPRERGVVLLLRDITERLREEKMRRELIQRMEQRQKIESLGVLAEGMAHDFNNLLMIIAGNADMAAATMTEGGKDHSAMLEIQTAAKNAAQLCRQMLAYAGKGLSHIELIDVSQVIESTSMLIKSLLPKSAIFETQLPSGLPQINGNTAQIRQLVLNLASNAAEALGDKPGSITVLTTVRHCTPEELAQTHIDDKLPGGNYIVIEMVDTGEGIPAEIMPKICDPFFSTRVKGRGLGLAAALGIVRGHKGAFQCISKPGHGTTMRVMLPVAENQGGAEERSFALADDKGWRGSGLVLLVDDDPAVRLVTRHMLEKLGFKVLAASGGAAAVDLFRQHAADIVLSLLDLTMPDMDGIETYSRIREIRPDAKALLASGYGAEAFDGDERLAGLAGFIEKPFTLARLQTDIRFALGRQD